MKNEPCCWAVIPAAGIGARFGSSFPKQYARLNNQTVLENTLAVFLNSPKISGVIVALHADDQHFSTLAVDAQAIQTVEGGETRAHSVLNALTVLQQYVDKDDYVLVHDAARPCLLASDLDKLIDTVASHEVGGILATPVSDTLKRESDHSIVDTVSRDHLWRALTPQMFRFELLLGALTHAIDNKIAVTDEAQAIELQGKHPCIVEGDVRNIKITTQEDLEMAALFLESF